MTFSQVCCDCNAALGMLLVDLRIINLATQMSQTQGGIAPGLKHPKPGRESFQRG